MKRELVTNKKMERKNYPLLDVMIINKRHTFIGFILDENIIFGMWWLSGGG